MKRVKTAIGEYLVTYLLTFALAGHPSNCMLASNVVKTTESRKTASRGISPWTLKPEQSGKLETWIKLLKLDLRIYTVHKVLVQ